MSLKAKLEAVIYAAEEPVTLAQLALLFTADALEWKAEQEAASAALAANPSGDGGPSSPQNDEIDYAALEEAGAETEAVLEPVAVPPAEAAPEADAGEAAPAVAEGEDAKMDAAADEDAEADTEVDAEAEVSAEAAAAAALRREARLRDKEVRGILRQILDELIAEYASDNRGVEIREIAGGYRMATKPECHDAVRAFIKALKPALKLSLPALETLAVVAYKQPVTAPEVNEIRGVDSSGVFGSLLARKLIATAGRKPVIGRPILYKTTKEFLLRFGLKDVTELPSMEEFEKMAAMELDEPDIAESGMKGQREATADMREDLSLEEDGLNGEATEDEAAGSESNPPEAAPAAPPPTE
jgi:segregation and condensation protein B